MEKTLFALSLGFAGVILATHAGWTAPSCAPRDQVMQVFAKTRPDDATCRIASGRPSEAAPIRSSQR